MTNEKKGQVRRKDIKNRRQAKFPSPVVNLSGRLPCPRNGSYHVMPKVRNVKGLVTRAISL